MPPEALPSRPSLDQLRRRAKELRDAARAGDPVALARITAHTPGIQARAVTLAAAQLAVAREHGSPSWPRLVAEVRARTAELGQRVDEFLVASIRDWTGRAARMLARDPWIAGYDFRTAVILGDAARVRQMLAGDPGLATRPDERTGWTALHAACASRWHRLDPGRADGLTEVARLLLETGADVAVRVSAPGRPAGQDGGDWLPLLCAVAGEANPAITALLLEYGARPDDHVLYLAAFEDSHACLRLLLPYAPDIAASTALSAPISTGNVAGVRLLLDAGADPNHLLDAGLLGGSHEQDPPVPPLSAAVDLESGPEMVGLLLERGADPDVPGWHGRTPYQQAIRTGQNQVADLLARYGASTVLSGADEFLAACRRPDRTAATAISSADPGLAGRLTAEEHRVLADAADHGHTEAVRLMLDLGFPPGTRSEQDDGATVLHLAASAGSPATVRLLLDRGADIEARDTTWNATPLEWAIVGSGMRLGHAQDPDWPATVSVLLDAGASTDGITLSPDDPKPPSPEVAALLRTRGIPDEEAGGTTGR
ncbi:MAG TPA: ankyrin repeat domain-containing protein [Streptosporangiaceae bacterium]|nr:ankyrin repeat domain-containing protein [Streptosporangiaceae bacterium]